MASLAALISGSSGEPDFPAGPISGKFGQGRVKGFVSDGTFTVPDGVTAVRARLWGAGGAHDGGGGGFAIKEITGLTPGASIAVTVGECPDNNSDGGSSSFGAHLSATGGSNGDTGDGSGGTGTGGDFNSTGGTGGSSGGGGAAGVFGDGGDAGSPGNAGGGGSAIGAAGIGITGKENEPGQMDALDFLSTGGGSAEGGHAMNGGGGGKNSIGGFPAGGGDNNRKGGDGLVIVEW